MSIKQKHSDAAAPKGSAWKKNVIFALVVLALAAPCPLRRITITCTK